jgi:LPXTG-motif cell wall-anchored protein
VATTSTLPADPPAGPPIASLADTTLVSGQQLSLAEPGFPAGSTVTAAIYSSPTVLGSAVADAQGLVRLTITVPGTLPAGRHTLVLAGGGTVRRTEVTVEGGLPKTGIDTRRLVVGGLGLLASGAMLVASSRQRRRSVGRA